MPLTRDALLGYLHSQFSLDTGDVTDETALFSTGMLDSLAVAELLMFIEQQAGFIAEPTEITVENLDSVARILAFAQARAAHG